MGSPPKKRRYYKRWLEETSGSFWLIKKRPWLLKLLAVLFLLPLVGLLTGGWLLFFPGDLKDDRGRLLDWEKIERGEFKKTSYVYDYEGKEILGRFFYEIRDPVKEEEIPDRLAKGFLAAEDQRFYSPFPYYWVGIDPRAIVRAGVFNKFHQWGIKYFPKSGASGIPQQVARLIYAEEIARFKNREPTLNRKWLEAQVAIQLGKRYSKDKLLTTLLNQIYFGHGVNGIAEARRYYFGRDLAASPLDLREIAILVSLNKSSKKYCPIFHEPAMEETSLGQEDYEQKLAAEQARVILARGRYNWVLERMLDEKYITPGEFEQARFKKEESLALSMLKITPVKNPRFGYGNRIVKEMLLGQGFTDTEIVSSRGLTIKTGIDPFIQNIAVDEVNKQLAVLNTELSGSDQLEGSFVAIENKTGRIVAISGGHNFSETQYNRALALRSPGSAFKPMVFAAAFEFHGKTFDDLICNCPFSRRGADGKRWTPKNFPEEQPVPIGYGPLPLILIRSVNLGTLNLAMNIGMDSIIETAHRLGLWGEKGIFKDEEGEIWFKMLGAERSAKGLDPRLPTAIGASGVSLLELVNAYTVFQRGGIYLRPTLIWEIKDADGKLVYKAEPQAGQRGLSEETARKITILLRAVTKVGTAKISMRGIEQQVAAKTGTSNGPDDVSFIWYTPEYTFGIRIGYDHPKPIALPQYMKKMAGRESQPVSAGWVLGFTARAVTDRIYEGRSKAAFSTDVEEGVAELLKKFAGKI